MKLLGVKSYQVVKSSHAVLFNCYTWNIHHTATKDPSVNILWTSKLIFQSTCGCLGSNQMGCYLGKCLGFGQFVTKSVTTSRKKTMASTINIFHCTPCQVRTTVKGIERIVSSTSTWKDAGNPRDLKTWLFVFKAIFFEILNLTHSPLQM